MQYNYRSLYLVVIDGDVFVYKYEKKINLISPSSLLNQFMFLLVDQKFVI